MRVLQVLRRFYPESLGGVEVYVAALSKQLQDLGLTVTIAAPAGTAAAYDHHGPSDSKRDRWSSTTPFRRESR